MNEDKLDPNNLNNVVNTPENQPEIIVNDYGQTRDSAVVIEEADRTVLLTDNETIVIPRETYIDIAPKNRPRKVYGGMWGPLEIAAVAIGMMTLVGAALLYFAIVLPSSRQLARYRSGFRHTESIAIDFLVLQ